MAYEFGHFVFGYREMVNESITCGSEQFVVQIVRPMVDGDTLMAKVIFIGPPNEGIHEEIQNPSPSISQFFVLYRHIKLFTTYVKNQLVTCQNTARVLIMH